MDEQITLVYRYTALVQLWQHHNTVQLQWPVVIISVVLVGLATLSSNVISTLVIPTNWGTHGVVMVVGACYVVAAVAIAAMVYTMYRARLIMSMTEVEIMRIEERLGIISPALSFGTLNHPAGRSGPLFLRVFVTVAVGAPIAVLGFLFLAGTAFGSIPSLVVVILTWKAVRNMLSHRG